ncbi:hypothetical protein GLOIN_2v1767988 [Rhizophagus clarus]|uniref:Uncharacterized protein n=1 Tax=Rhizophagus clarus TaxID=94130 RepID=A0A8H3LPZ1_9GLOM|nr:hypothetical protein GLOIN_2v1767988 [Rhizophagus clarus]
MSPNKAVKRALKGKKIIARPSVKYRRPIGYNEPLLPSYTEVWHLLKLGELEENQSILYKLYNGPRRSFVREELQIVKDAQLPPQWMLKH